MLKKILGFAGKKAFEIIKPKTNVPVVVQPFKYKSPKSKLEKVTRDLQIATQKESGKIKKYIQKMESDIEPFRRKLRQTTQKIDNKPVTESGFNKGKDIKKAKGGRIGRKGGGDLGMQSVKYGLDNNPKITAADPKAKFIAANKKKKNKKKII